MEDCHVGGGGGGEGGAEARFRIEHVLGHSNHQVLLIATHSEQFTVEVQGKNDRGMPTAHGLSRVGSYRPKLVARDSPTPAMVPCIR